MLLRASPSMMALALAIELPLNGQALSPWEGDISFPRQGSMSSWVS